MPVTRGGRRWGNQWSAARTQAKMAENRRHAAHFFKCLFGGAFIGLAAAALLFALMLHY